MILPQAPDQYSKRDQQDVRTELRKADRQNRKQGVDIELSSDRVIMRSPDGTRWAQGVSNAGETTWTALPPL